MSNPALQRFKDIHSGEQCVIVCNGPSLNCMDLSFLRRETVFGLNKIFLGFSKFGFYPDYLVAVNDKVIEQSVAQLRDITAVKFVPWRSKHLLPPDAFTYHIKTRGVSERFTKDIAQGLHEGYTVTHVALQIAYYMGFSRVIIIGMDHQFSFSGQPNSELFLDSDDPNHFSPNYFRGNKWDAPDLVESEISYRAARAAFEMDGRQIINATKGGACEVFRREDYRKIFGP